MPAEVSGGMAGLLKGAGAGESAPVSAPAQTSMSPSVSKGMAGLLSEAKDAAPETSAPATPAQAPVKSPFVAPLFGVNSMNSPKVDMKDPFSTPLDKATKANSQALATEFKPFKDAVTTPTKAEGFFDTLKESFNNSVDEFNNNVDEWRSGGPLDKVDAWVKTGLIPINLLFSPITAATQSLQQKTNPIGDLPVIPGVLSTRQLADGFNRLFDAIGAGGTGIATTVLDGLPISDSAKQSLRPSVSQLGALAAQILTGKLTVGGGEDGAPTEIPDAAKTEFVDTAEKLGHGIVEAMNDPKTHEVLQQRESGLSQPIKAVGNFFNNSLSVPEIQKNINTGKATDMHPTLRQEIRDNLQQHGPGITRSALMSELGAGERQARSLIREAPTPQSAAEEATAHQNALRSAVGDAQLAPDKMRVIPMGPKGKPSLDTIDAETGKVTKAVKPGKGEVTVEPIKETPQGAPAATSVAGAQKLSEKVIPNTNSTSAGEGAPSVLKPVESASGEMRPSTLSAKVDANVVERKLASTLGDTPQYAKTSWGEQASKAIDLLNNDPARAVRIATGQEAPPSDVLAGSVFTAVEEHATQTGDVETLRQLAQGNASGQFTRFGQEIGSLSQRSQDGAVAKIAEVQKAREGAFKKSSGKGVDEAVKETTKELKQVTRNAAPKFKDVKSFIESLKC